MNATPVVPVKCVPVTVTEVDVVPLVGVKELIVGAAAPLTVKLPLLMAVKPLLVALIGPVVAPLGTLVVIWVSETTVKVAEMVGYPRVADVWSTKLGIGAPIKPYPALALGSFEATPFEMATAYNVLANGGLKIEPMTVVRVTDDKDRTLEQHSSPPPERVVLPLK